MFFLSILDGFQRTKIRLEQKTIKGMEECIWWMQPCIFIFFIISAFLSCRYCSQYECVKKMCSLYETDDSNASEIMQAMQEVSEIYHTSPPPPNKVHHVLDPNNNNFFCVQMQEFGQPPADIIQELAPGFNPSGEGGDIPQMPELEELLKMGGPGIDKDKCTLM